MKVILFNIKCLLIGCFLVFITNEAKALLVIESVSQASNGECNGAINLTAIGDDGPYSFSWSNGTSNSWAHFLCPGSYTVTVTDIYGCEESLTIEVRGCALYLDAIVTPGCSTNNTLGTIILNSNYSDYEYSDIAWSTIGEEAPDAIFANEGAANLVDGLYCVAIQVSNGGASGDNCDIRQCFYINTVTDCSDVYYPPPTLSSPPVIINEVSNGLRELEEYYELLVVGTGTGSCDEPETFDLRGFIVDDNNGDFSFIQGGVLPYDRGFATGHIRFKYIDRWKEVPVGSLILIYNDGLITLENDPDDSDEDKSYIVPISDDGLEGTVNRPGLYTSLGYFPFLANYYPANWDAIPMYNKADSPQIRYPNGGYCHGISFGPLDKMTGGPDDLHVYAGDATHKCFYFDGFDFLNKNNYKSAYAQQQETPGYPNSYLNAEFIANLCTQGFMRNEESQVVQNITLNSSIEQEVEERVDKGNTLLTKEKNVIASVYPNPSAGDVTLELESNISTTVTVNIVTLYGQELLQKKVSITEGENTLKLNLKQKGILPSGVLLMNVIDESSRHLIDIFKIVLVEE